LEVVERNGEGRGSVVEIVDDIEEGGEWNLHIDGGRDA
jgi:hypothetical protein